VGAGTGTDVAIALSKGARHIDAVEIDPRLQQIGAQLHPNHPYEDPRVSVYIDDGRAFLEQTNHHYDLILFALPDSLTLLAGQGNLRLENYLFTIESMRKVKSLLKPGGTFAMYNYYESWLLDRYASTLQTVYGMPPCVEVGDPLAGRQQAVLTIGAGATTRCRTPWQGEHLSAPTDDHPFPYLRTRTIPTFYLKTLGLMLLGSLLLIRVGGGSLRGMSHYVDLAFMGAAFLLLETTNVVKFALLFGTTWFVNALVFTGVLLSVYAAVEVARHVRLPSPTVLYGLLLAALVVAWAVPQSSLLGLSPVLRFFAATALAFAPIFLANLVFAQRFRDVGSSAVAFGANLLGAMVGGLLEYASLIVGYRALLLVAAALYGLAFLLGRRHVVAPRRMNGPRSSARSPRGEREKPRGAGARV
jgi:spermine/spermidine synthase